MPLWEGAGRGGHTARVNIVVVVVVVVMPSGHRRQKYHAHWSTRFFFLCMHVTVVLLSDSYTCGDPCCLNIGVTNSSLLVYLFIADRTCTLTAV